MQRHWILGIVSLASLAAAEHVRADYITGVTVADFSSQSLPWARYADNVLNGSGLNAGGHTSWPDATMWDISEGDTAPRITFNLGASYQIDSLHVWNYNAGDFNGYVYRERAAKEVVISTSLDGTAFTSLGTFTFSLSPGADGYFGETIILGGVTATFVRFDILSNYSAQGLSFGTGLSEVRFTEATAVPEPASVAMLALGGLGVGLAARRSRRSA